MVASVQSSPNDTWSELLYFSYDPIEFVRTASLSLYPNFSFLRPHFYIRPHNKTPLIDPCPRPWNPYLPFTIASIWSKYFKPFFLENSIFRFFLSKWNFFLNLKKKDLEDQDWRSDSSDQMGQFWSDSGSMDQEVLSPGLMVRGYLVCQTGKKYFLFVFFHNFFWLLDSRLWFFNFIDQKYFSERIKNMLFYQNFELRWWPNWF